LTVRQVRVAALHASVGDDLVVLVAGPDGGGWWRAFAIPYPVALGSRTNLLRLAALTGKSLTCLESSSRFA
jgi:hypothetical protein